MLIRIDEDIGTVDDGRDEVDGEEDAIFEDIEGNEDFKPNSCQNIKAGETREYLQITHLKLMIRGPTGKEIW